MTQAARNRDRRLGGAVLSLAFLVCGLTVSPAQTVPGKSEAKPAASLADSLRRAGTDQLHIFYIHGIGAQGPEDYDSQLLRKSICKFLKDCTTAAGQLEGTDYADKDKFALNAAPPALTYLGQPIWKNNAPGGRSEEWNASAPYVDHWKIVRGNGAAIYVDEINWWPLAFALKCRQIVAGDAALAGPNVPYIDLCSSSEPDLKNPGRFRLYPWINPAEAQRLKGLPAKSALINRKLKNGLLDWGFSDALLAVGPMQRLLLEGVRQLVLKSVATPADGSEFVIVSHSLGSYLIFAALDLNGSDADTPKLQEWQRAFEDILRHTSSVYFFANQLRLLELADLGSDGNMIDHLKYWGQLRRNYLASRTGSNGHDLAPPQIFAWSDPSDLLTWDVPELEQDVLIVKNRFVRNAPHWFWLFEGPTSAHDNYASNRRVIRAMLKPDRMP